MGGGRMEQYLEDLENRIDQKTENDLFEQWVDFTEGRFKGAIFSPLRGKPSLPSTQWPLVRVNETLNDEEKMMMQQYSQCSNILQNAGGQMMCVRSNYGTGILPSLFGAELFIMDDLYNTLPTSRPIPGGLDTVKKLIQKGIPDLYHGYGSKVLEMGQRFVDIGNKYPKIGKYIHIYHPDLQGPLDVCELLVGSALFLLLIDEPNLMHELLELVTNTYMHFMKEWLKIVPCEGLYSIHWSILHKGCIMLRDDSAMNLSGAMFDEFIKPYDQRLLDEFGGGALHFCGRGDHYIKSASEMRGLYAVNMSQPHYNNMNVIYKNTVDKNIKLVEFPRIVAMEAMKNGINFHSCIQSSPTTL